MYRRNILHRVSNSLSDTPVVLVNGPRQSGKSTLVQQIGAMHPDARYVTMDDATVLASVAADPIGWVERASGLLILDEVQKVPALFPAIKLSVDRDRRPGRFLLTGSANVMLLPTISESLAGRIDVCTLWPLSQGELAGGQETFIDRLFAQLDFREGSSAADEPGLIDRLLVGGFPEVQQRKDPLRREAWFDAYVTTLLQRDVRDLANIEGLTAMPRLLMLLASRVAGLLNIADLTRSVGVPHSTLTRYLSLLELLFLIQRVPAWPVNIGKRLVKAPKIYLCDTGLAARLNGTTPEALSVHPIRVGPLLENFVAGELRKQAGWSRTRPSLYHYRTSAGAEVDFLLEAPGGRVAAVEIKASSDAHENDFAAMRALAADLGEQFVCGVVLYRGRQTAFFGPQFAAVPMQELWSVK